MQKKKNTYISIYVFFEIIFGFLYFIFHYSIIFVKDREYFAYFTIFKHPTQFTRFDLYRDENNLPNTNKLRNENRPDTIFFYYKTRKWNPAVISSLFRVPTVIVNCRTIKTIKKSVPWTSIEIVFRYTGSIKTTNARF